jgi:hypothetical protein
MKKVLLVSLLVAVLALTTLTALVLAAPGGVTDPDTLQALAAARAATDKYHDVSVAGADGYAPATECIEVPSLGAMGIHYINFGLLDGSFNSTTPEILLYVPAGNGLRLVAVEYIVAGPVPGDLPGDDDVWEFHEASCHYTDGSEESCASPANADPGKVLALWHPDLWALHVWLWQANPNGIFEDFNPKARC